MTAVKKSYQRGQVVQIIQSVIEKMDTNAADKQAEIVKNEIKKLAEKIEALKSDIAQSSPEHLQNEKIPGATDELDAVVEATAEATNSIMGACETIEGIAGTLDGDTEENLTAQVTQIYEACGFQDITGQRITKVVGTLKEIDHKISELMKILNLQVGPIDASAVVVPPAAEDRSGDAALMNGPQMPDKAVTQDDIDKLLAEFD